MTAFDHALTFFFGGCLCAVFFMMLELLGMALCSSRSVFCDIAGEYLTRAALACLSIGSLIALFIGVFAWVKA